MAKVAFELNLGGCKDIFKKHSTQEGDQESV
jgi:hypothetical protein